MAKVKLVLSWSGPASRAVARALRDWLPMVIQGVDPWMSEEDIQKGAQWLPALQRTLAECGFGIMCVTPENLAAEWLHFEAGAMWKAYEQNRVCPFLVGIAGGASDVKPPLGLFQACDSTNDDEVFRMMKAINLSLPDADRLSEVALKKRSFKAWLPDLRERLSEIATRRDRSSRASSQSAGYACRDSRDRSGTGSSEQWDRPVARVGRRNTPAPGARHDNHGVRTVRPCCLAAAIRKGDADGLAESARPDGKGHRAKRRQEKGRLINQLAEASTTSRVSLSGFTCAQSLDHPNVV